MSRQDEVWTIATSIVTHSYKASFGSGNSTLAGLHNFCWDPVSESFIIADKDDLLWGAWRWKKFPCSKDLALALLVLCASEEVQAFFNPELPLREVNHQLWSCDESLVAIHRCATESGRGISLEFYNPENLSQEVTLSASLAHDFLRNIKGLSSEAILKKLDLHKISV